MTLNLLHLKVKDELDIKEEFLDFNEDLFTSNDGEERTSNEKQTITMMGDPLFIKNEPMEPVLEERLSFDESEESKNLETFGEREKITKKFAMNASAFYSKRSSRIRINLYEGIFEEQSDSYYEELPDDPNSDVDEFSKPLQVLSDTVSKEFSEERVDINDEIEDATDESQPSTSAIHSGNSNENQETVLQGTGTTSISGETRWRKRNLPSKLFPFLGSTFSEVGDIPSPFQYFKHFFDDNIIEHIVEQTNLFMAQEKLAKNLKCKIINTDISEMEQFIGVLLFMGIYPSPQYRTYWSPAAPLPQITRALKGGVNRFEALKRFVHFNDNSKIPDRNSTQYDKLYKIRPIINSVLEKCKALETEEYSSVDEQIIPTKCKSSLNHYSPTKPHKWGYKVFTRCGASGIIYNFEIYAGKSCENHQSSLGVTGDLVMRLCENIPKQQNYKVCFDNYFTSLPLLNKLFEQGVLALGTIRGNRMGGAQKILLNEKELKIKGRGSSDWRTDISSNITVIRWQDNSTVQLASTYLNNTEGEKVKRWSTKDKGFMDIECPLIVHEYNRFMGGVDLCDMLLSLYRIKLTSRKWYMPIFYYLIKVSITNGWLLYRRHYAMIHSDNKFMSLFEFQVSVANDLTMDGKSTSRGRPPSPSQPPRKKGKASAAVSIPTCDFRYDSVDHFPEFDDKKHRCRNCPNGYTYVKCIKCNIFLCLLKDRNCFLKFHKENM